MNKCIHVEVMGDSEECTFERFADIHIQADDVARRIAQDMLDGEDPYEINDDFPQRFTVTDRDELIIQVEAFDKSL